MKKISKKLIVFILIVLGIMCICSFSNADLLEDELIGMNTTTTSRRNIAGYIVGITQIVLVAISIIIPMISVIKYLIKRKKLNEEERKKAKRWIGFSIFIRIIFIWFFYNTWMDGRICI